MPNMCVCVCVCVCVRVCVCVIVQGRVEDPYGEFMVEERPHRAYLDDAYWEKRYQTRVRRVPCEAHTAVWGMRWQDREDTLLVIEAVPDPGEARVTQGAHGWQDAPLAGGGIRWQEGHEVAGQRGHATRRRGGTGRG
jgi:hypothetical protein